MQNEKMGFGLWNGQTDILDAGRIRFVVSDRRPSMLAVLTAHKHGRSISNSLKNRHLSNKMQKIQKNIRRPE